MRLLIHTGLLYLIVVFLSYDQWSSMLKVTVIVVLAQRGKYLHNCKRKMQQTLKNIKGCPNKYCSYIYILRVCATLTNYKKIMPLM